MEYASAIFVREKSDTLQLEIRSTQGTLDFIRLTGDSIHFQANDSTIRLFRQFMLHGFEIGTKPKENGGGLCILLRPPMNYEGFAIAINGKGEAAIEKVLSDFVHNKAEGLQAEEGLSQERRFTNGFDVLGL